MNGDGYLLGFDVGSSSIKAALLEVETGKLVCSATSPKMEMAISAPRPGWAEQDPALWWENIRSAAAECKAAAGRKLQSVRAIGISYQMHGLVLVDSAGAVLRPSIIWCDSRAVELGEEALAGIGPEVCRDRLRNSPGNFTASKLAWVKRNEASLFQRASRFLLPGEWVALRMTGEARTTPSGLSEGILWDFSANGIADIVLDWYGIPATMVPDRSPTFSAQGTLSAAAAAELGLPAGIPVSYRAGDQPNNAFSLNVLEPGEAAATAGTSGVVYGVTEGQSSDPASRVNTFVHVNHTREKPRYGVLMCVNGTGILYSWIRRLLVGDTGVVPYDELNRVASTAPIGSDGLVILPYGNGAERTLENRNPGASFLGVDFNRHAIPHLLRAAQEGIAFALQYGIRVMRELGIRVLTVKAGDANLFKSPLFREAFATVSGARVELYDTDGAQGAARGAGLGARIYASPAEAFTGLAARGTVEPDRSKAGAYADAYERWERALKKTLG